MMQLIIIRNPLIRNALLNLSFRKFSLVLINPNIEATKSKIAEIVNADGNKKIPK